MAHETKFNLRFPYLTNVYSTYVWLGQLDSHPTSKPVMISVLSLIPTGGNLFFTETFLKALDDNSVQKFQEC